MSISEEKMLETETDERVSDRGPQAREVVSIDINRWTKFFSLLGQGIVVFAAAIGAAGWVGNVTMKNVLQEHDVELKVEAERRHEETLKLVDYKIELHRTSGVHPGALTEAEIAQITSGLIAEIATMKATLVSLENASEKHDKKLDQLLARSR